MGRIQLTFFCLLLLSLAACNDSQEPLPPPNILWITSEDNSKHYMKLFDDNGVETPNIARLSAGGVRFTRAFSNAPVCSVARSTLISGCYAPRVGAQYHRKIEKVPMPEGVEMFPAYLRSAGYYTSNNSKEDYNFFKSDSVWDESSREASWRNRAEGQPFFHVQNFTTTHESRLHFTVEQMDTTQTNSSPEDVFVFPNHPQTDLFRYTNAYYRDKIQQMDAQVGVVLDQITEDGLMDETIIFYFGDHGGVLPGSKGYIYESGLHIPLVVYAPEQYREWLGGKAGGENAAFVSFVDFGPSVLNIAGVDVPAGMDGRPFLGPGLDWEGVQERNTTFGYADRFDEKYDFVRSVRVDNFKYIRSFQPYNFDGLMNNYRYRQLAYKEWWDLSGEGQLNDIQNAFFGTRPVEMLFDLEADPYETENLAMDEAYAEQLKSLRSTLREQMLSLPDLSLVPEHVLLEEGLEDPVAFGQQQSTSMKNYLQISELALGPFDAVQEDLRASLSSEDPWERYWGITACTILGEEAASLASDVRGLAESDPESLNRMRAAEFLRIALGEDPVTTLLAALYAADQPAEGLMILNSLVLMQDGYGHKISLDVGSLQEAVRDNPEAGRRLLYLVPDQVAP